MHSWHLDSLSAGNHFDRRARQRHLRRDQRRQERPEIETPFLRQRQPRGQRRRRRHKSQPYLDEWNRRSDPAKRWIGIDSIDSNKTCKYTNLQFNQ